MLSLLLAVGEDTVGDVRVAPVGEDLVEPTPYVAEGIGMTSTSMNCSPGPWAMSLTALQFQEFSQRCLDR